MKVIGLTGGVGCGKSTVTTFMKEKYHAYIIDTDTVARNLLEPAGEAYAQVLKLFGTTVKNPDGTINRALLADIVFQDESKRLALNALTHPKVNRIVRETIQRLKENEEYPYLLLESALFIESGYYMDCDEVWYVDTPESQRRERLKKSRGYSDKKIDLILASQKTAKEFEEIAQVVLDNSGDEKFLQNQITEVIIGKAGRKEHE